MVLSGSRRFCVVIVGSRWFSMFLCGSRRFSLVLNVFQWFLLVLIGSQCSHRF